MFYRMHDVKLGTPVAKITSDQHSVILYKVGSPLPDDIAGTLASRYRVAVEQVYDELNLTKDTLEEFYTFVKTTFPTSVSVHDGNVSVLIDPWGRHWPDPIREKYGEWYREWIQKLTSSMSLPKSLPKDSLDHWARSNIVFSIAQSLNQMVSSVVSRELVWVDDRYLGKYIEEGETLRELEEIAKEYQLVPQLDRLVATGVYCKDGKGKLTYLPYMMYGSGFLKLLMLLAKLKKAEQGILLIEEPENHLHPGYLSVFVDQLMVLTKRLKVQVFMTTHSYDLIEELARHHVTPEEREMIQISRIVNRKGIHELHNYPPELALEEMRKFKMDLRGT